MSNPYYTDITVKQESDILHEALSGWAQKRGGAAKVMLSPAKLWQETLNATVAPKLLICYIGESSRGAEYRRKFFHRVDRQWKVVVLFGHGFDEVDTQGQTNPQHFYETVEQVRDLVRSILNVSAEFPVDYKSCAPVPALLPGGASGNVFLDAYELNFATANDIPDIQMPA